MRPDSIKQGLPNRSIGLSPEKLAQLLLGSACSAQSRLAAIVTHELNSPIGALQSALQSISFILAQQEVRTEESSKLREIFCALEQVAQDACGRLGETLGQIQRLARLDQPDADNGKNLKDALALLPAESEQKLNLILNLEPLCNLKLAPQTGTIFQNFLANLIHDSAASTTPSGLPELGETLENSQSQNMDTHMTSQSPYVNTTQTEEVNQMNQSSVSSEQHSRPVPQEHATYFGMSVEVIDRMSTVSLIRYQNLEFIVETQDLKKERALGKAA